MWCAMDNLTPERKRALRAAGRALPALGAVGKAGLTGAVVASIGALLDRHELVKVRLGRHAGGPRREAAQQVARLTGSLCLAAVGRTVLLYRPGPDAPSEPSAADGADVTASR